MSRPSSYEEALIRRAKKALDDGIAATAATVLPDEMVRLEVLEACASLLGGFPLDDYPRSQAPVLALDQALAIASRVNDEIGRSKIHPSLALPILARPQLSEAEARTGGVYYTDFRLARRLAEPATRHHDKLIDPAAGGGTLLVAAGLARWPSKGKRRTAGIAESVYGADLSPWAVRSSLMAVASLVDSPEAIGSIHNHIRVMDSLVAGAPAWLEDVPERFGFVIANPPWEKLRVTRHEFMRARGEDRHYGAAYSAASPPEIAAERTRVGRYARALADQYPLLGDGEADLYKAFLELALRLVRSSGELSILLPAGLIRSLGTKNLRRHLFETCELDVTVFDNRSRFFAIDSRFKFLAVRLMPVANPSGPVVLRFPRAATDGILPGGEVDLDRATLIRLQHDLTIPEVRDRHEWRTFVRMHKSGVPFGSAHSAWQPAIVRELDMTADSHAFQPQFRFGYHPLVEGRMVHQFRYPAKRFAGGSGRRAKWSPVGARANTVPQFWIAPAAISDSLLARVLTRRVGFCDVTGQTNERSLLAAEIPPGAICGNKVPTIVFASDELHYGWLAVANSLPVDWLFRRLVTTSANFFLLRTLPLPDVQNFPTVGRRLASLAMDLTAAWNGAKPLDAWSTAERRAEIDLLCLQAYGLDLSDLDMMFRDFPLLDRGQPPIAGEARSTITRDFVLCRAAERAGIPRADLLARLDAATDAGAVPYVPSELGFHDAATDDASEPKVTIA